jgi:hypothetical protein
MRIVILGPDQTYLPISTGEEVLREKIPGCMSSNTPSEEALESLAEEGTKILAKQIQGFGASTRHKYQTQQGECLVGCLQRMFGDLETRTGRLSADYVLIQDLRLEQKPSGIHVEATSQMLIYR